MCGDYFACLGVLIISSPVVNMVAVCTSIPPGDVNPWHWLIWLAKGLSSYLSAVVVVLAFTILDSYWRLIGSIVLAAANVFAIWTDIPQHPIQTSDAFDSCIWISKGVGVSVCALFLLYVACQVAISLVKRARDRCQSQV
jgi:hypothetical protein